MPMNNAERAKHAEQGLMQDCQSKEGRDGYDKRIDEAADLICDLLHLIRREGSQVFSKLQMAVINFEAEVKEDGYPPALLNPTV